MAGVQGEAKANREISDIYNMSNGNANCFWTPIAQNGIEKGFEWQKKKAIKPLRGIKSPQAVTALRVEPS